jgi:hypothetical protein
MRMTPRRLCVLIVLLIACNSAIHAQTPPTLAYGDVVTGEISNTTFEHTYSFVGNNGDVIVIEMDSVDRSFFNPLWAPVLILRTSDETVIADTTAAYSVDNAVLVAALTTSDEYTITAAREGGESGESTGQFRLTLNLIPQIMSDSPLTGQISSAEGSQYYWIRSEQPFSLHYTHLNGDFYPVVALNRIDAAEGGLDELAAISGEEISEAVIGRFRADTLYILSISEDAFDFNSDEVFADFEIRLQASE